MEKRFSNNWVRMLLFIFFVLPALRVFGLDYTRGVNNPNAQTLNEKTFGFSMLTYNNGGMQSKLIISIFEPLDIGISFDIQRALGDRKQKLNIPGALGKWKFTSGTNNFPIFVAIGYDSFFTDYIPKSAPAADSSLNGIEHLEHLFYGPYMVVTKPIYLFGFEQIFNIGIRVPVQPYYVGDDTAAFLGFDIPLGKEFLFQTEIDRIFFVKNRTNEILYNFGLKYSVIESFYISLLLMTGYHRPTNRVLEIGYHTNF